MTGGDFRGRRLRAPKGEATRPTSDRVRESLFAWLPELDGRPVLDLYAGTGALGIEALSRGARRAVFVERARPALAALGANLADLALAGATRVLRDGRARRAAPAWRARARAIDAIFMDPPYGAADARGSAARDRRDRRSSRPRGRWSSRRRGAILPGTSRGSARADERRYGDTRRGVLRHGSARMRASGGGRPA